MKQSKQQADSRLDKLIEQVRAGDERAFSKLVKQVEPYVYSISMKVCRDRDVADENVQDTFVNVYRKLDQFDGASKFTTWLYTVIVNNCRMKHRRRKIDQMSVSLDSDKEYEHVSEESLGAVDMPDRDLLNQELHKVLRSGMEKLTPEQREVFALRDLENMSAEETGTALGISVSAVKSRLHRARGVLRTELDRYYQGG